MLAFPPKTLRSRNSTHLAPNSLVPELPEVETMRRGIVSITGRTIASVCRPPCRKRPLKYRPPCPTIDRRLRGRTITTVGRRGKRVLLHFDDGQCLILEPRMTGLVLLSDPPTTEHLRLQIELATSDDHPNPQHLLFWDRRGLGTVTLLRPSEIDDVLGPRKLGPDALDIDADSLRSRLKLSRRPIKVALLDQTAVAGIGNLYAAEILHVAGIDPRATCHRLTRRQWSAIGAATHAVLSEAVRYEGSTLSDGTYRNALNTPGNYQNHHRVYDRADQPCPRCGTDIRRIVQAQRSTFFCPGCQSRRGARTEGIPNALPQKPAENSLPTPDQAVQ